MSQICDIHVLHAVILYPGLTVQTMYKCETSCHKLVHARYIRTRDCYYACIRLHYILYILVIRLSVQVNKQKVCFTLQQIHD